MAVNFDVTDSAAGFDFSLHLDDAGEAALDAWFGLHGAGCQAAGVTFNERAGIDGEDNRSTRAYIENLTRTLRPHAKLDTRELVFVAYNMVRNCQRDPVGEFRGELIFDPMTTAGRSVARYVLH